MAKSLNSLKNFWGGGLDQDSAPEHVAAFDFVNSWNTRQSGTSSGEDGYTTNIESNLKLVGDLQPGINKVVGAAGFEQIRAGVFFIYNSAGNHQIAKLDYDTDTLTILFTNLTDSGGESVLNLNPQYLVLDIKLVNNDYLIWNDANSPVGFTNLTTLESGGYGTVLEEDFSLIKPQCLNPPTGTYGSDLGQPANYLYGNLPQFSVQWVNAQFNYSAWSTRSKRIVPYQQNTPVSGSDVSQNNYIIVSVDIGSERAQVINIAAQFDDVGQYSIIKSVDRGYVLALPNTSVDVDNEISEAYDPATNLYSFAFYNNDIALPVNANEADLAYDYVPPKVGATEVVNGDIIANGDLFVGYDRPQTSVSVSAGGYDPNIDIPAGTYPDPLRKTGQFLGASGSGAGNHKRIMKLSLGGTPHTGDKVIIILADIRDATNVQNYTYPVPVGQNGNLAAVVASVTSFLNGAYVANGDGTYTITFIGDSYFSGQSFAVQLFFAGATVANSIPTVLDNTGYQLALSYFDKYGRYFPLCTDNNFILNTPSYAQVNGQAIEISWRINTASAPAGAVGYQWMTTKPPINNVLDTLATPLVYVNTWDAKTNSPALAVNTGTVGDTYQVTSPCSPADTSHYTNLGNNETYNTGDYVTYNGQSYGVVRKAFGDLTSTGNLLAFSLAPLDLFNSQYSTLGVDTILAYDFTPGDRCTLHYYIDGTNKVFINDPCVNLTVFGFDPATYVLKLEKPANFDTSVLDGKNVFLRVYTPAPTTQAASATQNSTVWYEIGEKFTITDGLHDTLNGIITDGGAYYKTRQFPDGLLPYANPPVDVLATDLNYSDFYASEFWSAGRVRSYNDELETTERKAIISWSESYVLGSKRNGLTRFYPANVYGTTGGQTSANFGAIRKLLMVNNELVCIQQLNHGSIPVYQTVYIDQAGQTTVAVSEKLFNPIRYTTSKHIGVGDAKESIAIYNNVIYWIDPNRSQPVRWEGNGCFPISMKMTKYFKSTLQAAFALGLKIIGWYDIYNDEYIISTQQPGAVISVFAFSVANWRYLADYTIAPADITITTAPIHSTPSYNSTTGILTLTPATNYVGNDTLIISFPTGSGTLTKNVCFNWTSGSGTVNPFVFAEIVGVNITTVVPSNSILVQGNDYPVAISITGTSTPQYSINGGAWTASAGTVSAGDTVQVRLTSSGSYSSLETATLTIDSQSAEFDVVTRANANFGASAQYGFTITSIADNTATGTPIGFATATIPSGSALYEAYTAITAGTIDVHITGTPLPGMNHVRISLFVNGVSVSTQVTNFAGLYTLTFPAPVTDPTTILIAFGTF